MSATMAIVIPVGPGDESWRDLLPQLAMIPASEIVIVWSDDQAPLVPAAHPDTRIRWLQAARGRASQMNAGAAATTASWLWFLHADSKVGADAPDAIQRHIAGDDFRLGYFDLAFLHGAGALMRLNQIGVWLRCRLFGIPFGDQGLLISRRLFDAVHGFDESLAAAEDHALVWRSRAAGATLRPIGATLWTSARKYAQQGWWNTTRSHLWATLEQARRFSRVASK